MNHDDRTALLKRAVKDLGTMTDRGTKLKPGPGMAAWWERIRAWASSSDTPPGHGHDGPELSTTKPDDTTAWHARLAAKDLDGADMRIRRIADDAAWLARMRARNTPVGLVADALGVEWCTSCARIKRCEPVARQGLCDWCATFKAEQGHVPATSLLEIRAQGGRVTSRDIERANRHVRPARARIRR